MMTLKLLATTGLLLIGVSANAWPKHLFWCSDLQSEPQRQVYFELEESHGSTGVGMLYVATLSKNAPTNTPWTVHGQAEVKADITWSTQSGRPTITAIAVDMGKSGKLNAKMSNSLNEYRRPKGYVKATLRNFNYPQGAEVDYCSYFYSTGPKPGMTGSN